MEIARCYKDLLLEIQIYNIRVEDIEIELDSLKRSIYTPPKELEGVDYSQVKTKISNVIPFEDIANRIIVLKDQLHRNREILDKKNQYRKKMKNNIKKLSGIDYHVTYLRDVEDLSLKDIAQKLNYDYSHIKRVSARNKRYEH